MAKRINRNIEPNQMEKRIYDLEQLIAKGGVGGKGANIRKEVFTINGAILQPNDAMIPAIQFLKDGETSATHYFDLEPSEGYENIEPLSAKYLFNDLDPITDKTYAFKHKWFDSDTNSWTDYYTEQNYAVSGSNLPIYFNSPGMSAYEDKSDPKYASLSYLWYDGFNWDAVAEKQRNGFGMYTRLFNTTHNGKKSIYAENQIVIPRFSASGSADFLRTLFDWGRLNNKVEVTFLEY